MASTIINTSRPIKDKDGNICMDYEFAQMALSKVKDYELTHKEPAPINPKFVGWLQEGVNFVNSGKGTFTDYKAQNIYKEFGDNYDMIIANTNRANEALEKKGTFDNQVMQIVKGESKVK